MHALSPRAHEPCRFSTLSRGWSDGAPIRLLLPLGAGVALLGLPWPQLPPAWNVGSLSVVALLLGSWLNGRPSTVLLWLGWLCMGLSCGSRTMEAALDARVPLCADEAARTFEAVLQGPITRETLSTVGSEKSAGRSRSVTRFLADVRIRAATDCAGLNRHRVRLSWYDAPVLSPGERWVLEGRLRPPWSFSNPGGFDYERWLLGAGLGGTGYITGGERLAGAVSPGTTLKTRLRQWLAELELRQEAVVLALMLGDDSLLTREDWRQLRDSGTVHLLVVSGLHVGIVAAVLCFLSGGVLRPFALLWPGIGTRRLAGAFGVVGSGAYVWLSGAGVPALRAWATASVLLLIFTSARWVPPHRVVLTIMAAMLVAQPLVVHQVGFWYSFLAVLALLSAFAPLQRRAGCGPLYRFGRYGLDLLRVQIVLFLALGPVLALTQGVLPGSGVLVNLLVVPLVTLIALPLILAAGTLGLWWETAGAALLEAADLCLTLVMDAAAAGAETAPRVVGLGGLAEPALIALTLLAFCLAPCRRWSLALVAFWWVLLLPDGWSPPGAGELRLTVLDVGQGTAVLIDTRQHRMIYDAGAAFPSGFNLGEAVVVPAFQQTGGRALDALVLSHDDLDHTGGAAIVEQRLVPKVVWSSFPQRAGAGSLPVRRSRCVAGRGWRWDGVSFEFLHPPGTRQAAGSDNDRSCVLRIETANASALLPGDITRRVESRLLLEPVDLLLAPHHGSATSSSRGFIRRADPAFVIATAARRSRYGHPHEDVLARYAPRVVRVTGREGALRWESWRPRKLAAWRSERPAYWRGAASTTSGGALSNR